MIEAVLLASSIATILRELKWEIKRRGEDRTDIVVTSPSGKLFTIELRTGEGSAHFASLAHAEKQAQVLADIEGQDVTPVVLTTQEVSPAIASAADKVGVELIEVSDKETGTEPSPEDIAISLVRRLEPGDSPT